MTKPAQSRDSGVIEVNDDFLITCNGCGKSWGGTSHKDWSNWLQEAIYHELAHHEYGHPEGFTVEIRDEIHGRWPLSDD